MTKFLFTLTFIFATITAFAQNYGGSDYPITFGISGGSNFAFIQVKSAHRQDVYTDSESPGSFGVNADFKFNDYFSIRPGIMYTGKGGTAEAIYADDKGNNTDVYNDYTIYYLEVPVNFIAHLPFQSGANIFLGAGPYFAYAFNGTNKQTLFNDDPVNYKIKFGSNGDLKSTDFGAATVLGFQAARGWSIGLNIDWGLTNILQNNSSGYDATQYKTITAYLSVGYTF